MSDNEDLEYRERKVYKNKAAGGVGGGIYGLAFIGAAIYFIGHAPTFWAGLLGFLEALVWPAILVYKLFEMLIK